MRLAKTFFIMALLPWLLCSCAAKGSGWKADVSPAEKNITELSSKIYGDSQLLEIVQPHGRIQTLDSSFPIECLREKDGYYRAAYLGMEKVAILVFDESGNQILQKICSAQTLKSDFEDLEEGRTLEDVQKVDPQGEYPFLYTGRNDAPRVSTHCTKDGYLITIEYDDLGVILDLTVELL